MLTEVLEPTENLQYVTTVTRALGSSIVVDLPILRLVSQIVGDQSESLRWFNLLKQVMELDR